MQDAKNSLASALLKRAFIAKAFRVPWSSIKFSRKGDPVHGKPCYGFPNGSIPAVDFNISHQAEFVALIGTTKKGVDVGVDITCVNERNDYRHIDQDGFDGFVDIYDEVFSQQELWDIKYRSLSRRACPVRSNMQAGSRHHYYPEERPKTGDQLGTDYRREAAAFLRFLRLHGGVYQDGRRGAASKLAESLGVQKRQGPQTRDSATM